MRKLILSGDDWFELKHTLELLVIVTNNAANEHENMAAHAQVAELSERYANLAKRDRERTENYKRLMALVESAERLPETKEETMDNGKLHVEIGMDGKKTVSALSGNALELSAAAARILNIFYAAFCQQGIGEEFKETMRYCVNREDSPVWMKELTE